MERRANVSVGGPLTDGTGNHLYNMGRLWIPTMCEVNGIVHNTNIAGSWDFQYPIFKDTVHQKWIWKPNNKHGLDQFVENEHDSSFDNFRGWWTATPSYGLSTTAMIFDRNGHIRNTATNDGRIHCLICFRIAKTD